MLLSFKRLKVVSVVLYSSGMMILTPLNANANQFGASITVEPIPSRIDLPGFPNLIPDVNGYIATVHNATLAEYFVPNTLKAPPNCNLVFPQDNQNLQLRCKQANTCADLRLMSESNTVFQSPLYSLEEWQNQFPIANGREGFYTNGNWFDIRGVPGFPYKSPCSNIFGLSVSDGMVVSRETLPDANSGDMLDAILWIQNPDGSYNIQFAPNSEIANYSKVKYAIGGFLLQHNGRIKRNSALSESTKWRGSGARSACGINRQLDTFTCIVAQSGHHTPGFTPKELANFLKTKFDTYHVMNLDNSGSSQFFYQNATTTLQSLKGDRHGVDYNQIVYRNIPNFLRVSVESITGNDIDHDEL